MGMQIRASTELIFHILDEFFLTDFPIVAEVQFPFQDLKKKYLSLKCYQTLKYEKRKNHFFANNFT